MLNLISRFECLEGLDLGLLRSLSSDELRRILCWLVGSVPSDESSAEDTGDIGTCTGASSQAGDEALTEEFRLKHLEPHSGQLKSFGCANVTADHINLVSMCYNLTSLVLCDVTQSCSLALVKQLNQLKNLVLQSLVSLMQNDSNSQSADILKCIFHYFISHTQQTVLFTYLRGN
jgi:hypothetical protein